MNREFTEHLLVSEYGGLLALLRKKARDPQLAADILNDAILTTLEHIKTGRITDPAHIAGYVFQVAMNLLRNHRRKLSERPDRRADLSEIAWQAIGQNDSQILEWAEQVRLLLRELPTERDRLLIKRFYLDEDDKEAICRDLGISSLHFDKIIFRARQRIRAVFESHGFKKTDFFSMLLPMLAP